MRDFKEKEINEKTTKKISNKEKSSLINASQIVLGEYTSKCNPKSTYEDLYNHPKERKSHCEKIKYKIPEYKLHPLTSNPIQIASHHFWSFDFYHPEKSKNHNSNDKVMIPNRNYNKIYDPITNRYLN